jgi:P27 family predicted phage terminase small subunit
MRGRKPKPTRLKLITGNPGKRPLSAGEPKPARPDTLRAPSGLSAGAKRCWRQVARQLHDAQILTQLDRPALALYCEAFARWTQANGQIQRFGAIVKAPSGYPIPSPYLSIANKAFDQMAKIMAEFGMTPSSRSRINAEPPMDDDSAWERLK